MTYSLILRTIVGRSQTIRFPQTPEQVFLTFYAFSYSAFKNKQNHNMVFFGFGYTFLQVTVCSCYNNRKIITEDSAAV